MSGLCVVAQGNKTVPEYFSGQRIPVFLKKDQLCKRQDKPGMKKGLFISIIASQNNCFHRMIQSVPMVRIGLKTLMVPNGAPPTYPLKKLGI
jgi:hypothetical protein